MGGNPKWNNQKEMKLVVLQMNYTPTLKGREGKQIQEMLGNSIFYDIL